MVVVFPQTSVLRTFLPVNLSLKDISSRKPRFKGYIFPETSVLQIFLPVHLGFKDIS